MNVKVGPKFKIQDKVYHVTPDSPEGIIIDIRYSFLTGVFEYQVAFSATEQSLWYYEHELSRTKNF